MAEHNIKLGDKVRCKITGFVGIAVTRSEFLNGCVQYEVQPKCKKDNKPLEGLSIDEQSLEVISIKPKKIVKRNTGGANNKMHSMKGF